MNFTFSQLLTVDHCVNIGADQKCSEQRVHNIGKCHHEVAYREASPQAYLGVSNVGSVDSLPPPNQLCVGKTGNKTL